MKDSTALMIAAESGRIDCVKVLMTEVGKSRKTDGTTALMFAAQNGFVECVRLLMAEADMVDHDGSRGSQRSTNDCADASRDQDP